MRQMSEAVCRIANPAPARLYRRISAPTLENADRSVTNPKSDLLSAPLRRHPSLLGKPRARPLRHAKLFVQNRWNNICRTELQEKLRADRLADFRRPAIRPDTCVRGETHPPGKWRS